MPASPVLRALHDQLRWPEPSDILYPSGSGPAVYARLAQKKLIDPLRNRDQPEEPVVGILVQNSHADEFDTPLGIVCEFSRAISPETLRELQRLAWNFCRSPQLITIEPQLIRSWSCYETPNFDGITVVTPVEQASFDALSNLKVKTDFHWVELASGAFVSKRQDRFPLSQRVDKCLLRNLSHVRNLLINELPIGMEGIAHDLLARVIFIQFLCQRKDSRGNPALNAKRFASLHEKGVLSKVYSTFLDILHEKEDTYRLFEWLNERFNGDLFPGDENQTEEQRKAAWQAEKHAVGEKVLPRLADFVSGQMTTDDGQRSLWPYYSFDAIPLEFVSSIYEEFVTKRADSEGVGEHYTPLHVIDFMLDKVLPWGGSNHEIKVLDPACGSGAFLVKVFQRLVNRWRNAHPDEEPPVSFLRDLLEQNLFGVDSSEQAIRVASFGLYLAMCDEIDPNHYWTKVRFPRLREVTLRTGDFFEEDIPGIRTAEDANTFQLVVGNAPWGDTSISPASRKWATDHQWPIADEQIGPLFLPKAAKLTAKDGVISMIQPAGSIMFNRSSTAVEAREQLFSQYKVDEVVNFSALRFHLFPEVVGPACVITMRSIAPDSDPIAYWSPKQSYRVADQYRIVIDAHDLNWVMPNEAAYDSVVWSALAWGGRRDLELVQKLREKSLSRQSSESSRVWSVDRGFQRGIELPSLASADLPKVWRNVVRKHEASRVLHILQKCLETHDDLNRFGVICYKRHLPAVESLPSHLRDRIKIVSCIEDASVEDSQHGKPACELVVVLSPIREHRDRLDRRILEDHKVWKQCKHVEFANYFPLNDNPFFERERELSLFRLPVLLMKESWTVEGNRFRAIVVDPMGKDKTLLFSKSFLSVRPPEDQQIASLAVFLNSSLAVHYFYLTSGRAASYRPALLNTDLEQIPLPANSSVTLETVRNLSLEQIDEHAMRFFQLFDIDRILVDDFFDVTLRDFKGDEGSMGRQPIDTTDVAAFQHYSKWFTEVLRAGFGADKLIQAAFYTTDDLEGFPYCVVRFHLNVAENDEPIEVRQPREAFRDLLCDLGAVYLQQGRNGAGIFHQRVARVHRVENDSPVVFIVKPNERRYWTRSMALRDADEVTADILQWDSVRKS